MKRFILISLIFVLLSSNLFAEPPQFIKHENISFDEFVDEYIPEYTLQKRIPLEGVGRAYAVAKDSGDIVAITEIGDEYKVHFFDIEGNLKWIKNFDKPHFDYIDCLISNNGETICIYTPPYMNIDKITIPTGLYGQKSTILSKEGDIIYTKSLEGTILIPSPDGRYLYKRTDITSDYRTSQFDLYNTDGSLVDIQGFDNMDVSDIRLKFVSENYILAYILKGKKGNKAQYLQFFKLEDQRVTTLWEYKIDPFQELYMNFDTKVKFNNNKIAVCGNTSSSKLYVFDFDGNLLYFEDTVYQSCDFLNENELFIQTHTALGYYSKLINISSKESRKEDITFRYGKYDFDEFDNVTIVKNSLLFSIKRNPYQDRTFYSSIINDNDWSYVKNLLHNIHSISIDNKKFFIFEKYHEDPEIVIFFGGEK